ncbi:phage minor capsid protein [Streptomyces sp. SID3343]|uniref:phage minor capsid protein n=1 Tax=Streptomyces sp. SID3343 TaxID=2690260 RepID=UPI00136B4AF6|nr:capsid protein [Streptomyces sp. SID3343]
MPVSPAVAENLATVLGDLYRAAEYSLIQAIRGALVRNEGLPTWAEDRLAALRGLSGALSEVLDSLALDADGTVRQALASAYDRGQAAAVAELGAVATGPAAVAAELLPTAAVVDRLAAAVLDTTTAVHSSILRQATDVYRQVIAQSAAAPVLGVETRRAATQQALNRFVDQGVARFVDSRGRAWGMAEYAEMALRSATGRAAIDAHSDRLGAGGQELVMVSEQPLHCARCDPWAGKILWRTGKARPVTVMLEHATEDGAWVKVDITGSLPDARSKGLLHPNCRCSVSVYLPGVSRPPRPVPHPAGATYEDTQRQRALERTVRKWKKREAGALDEATAKAARAKVRATQAKLRELTKNKDLRRKPERERPMAGHGGQGGPPALRTPTPPTPPTAAEKKAAAKKAADAKKYDDVPYKPESRRNLKRMPDEQLRAELAYLRATHGTTPVGMAEKTIRATQVTEEMRRRRMKYD